MQARSPDNLLFMLAETMFFLYRCNIRFLSNSLKKGNFNRPSIYLHLTDSYSSSKIELNSDIKLCFGCVGSTPKSAVTFPAWLLYFFMVIFSFFSLALRLSSGLNRSKSICKSCPNILTYSLVTDRSL